MALKNSCSSKEPQDINEKEIKDKKCPQCDPTAYISLQRCGMNTFSASQIPAVYETFLFPDLRIS
jgi:hypothetical protein